jgi:hypothetical protein
MYTLKCFSPDGQSVTEGEFKSIGECWYRSNDMGSRWIFYPIHVVTKGKTVCDIADEFGFMKRRKLTTLARYLRENEDEVIDFLNAY